jgi:hypothetical protein
MDQRGRRRIRGEVREEFQLGRALLFKVEVEKEVRAEIDKDRARLFHLLKQLPPEQQLEAANCVKRLLMNYSKLASYRGVLKGYGVFRTRLKLEQDRARFYLVEYLQDHREEKNENQDLVKYLDTKNGRLSTLRTRRDDPLWAWLPRSIEDAFRRDKTPIREGEFWEQALKKFPEKVMPYLSRARKMAEAPSVKNTLFVWPRIVREHKKRRKQKGGPLPED